ncbi:MAG: DUF4410 domain-containing protein [Rhodospirillales bacterium]|nr:DUF4410 domain-containing protein [Rhodospirillales bacterium]
MTIVRHTAAVIIAILVLAGCASSEVTAYQPYQGKLVRPERIVVYDFAATTSDLPAGYPISGPGLAAAQPAAEQLALGRKLGAKIAGDLVADLQSFGLPAVRAAGQPALALNDVAVVGYFATLDAGSATERVALGFGAGAADLQTVVNGFVMTAQGVRPLGSGTVAAGSGKTPGGAVPLVVAVATANPLGLAVSGAAKAYGEASGSETIEGAADRTAQDIAAKLKLTAERQGWI